MIKFKKIASLLTSALMVGSTIGLAAAANYPAPFVTGGSPNVGIVYGSSPTMAITDLVAAMNIMKDLDSAVVGGSITTTPGTVTGGDYVLIAKSSDNLNLGNTWGIFTGSIDDDDLTTLLADGTYSADDNDEFDYDQKITLGTPNFTHFRDSDYEDLAGLSDRTPTVGFHIPANTFIMNYTLDFTTDAESDLVSSDLDDIEGSDLLLLGKTYYVSNMDQMSGSIFIGKTTLLDSAVRGTVAEGETITKTLGDTSYDVDVNWMDDDEVVFNINGARAPASGTLRKGESYRVDGDTYIGVVDILKIGGYQTIGTTTFSLGSGKLEITSDAEVKLNDDTISGVKGYIYGTTSNSSTTNKIDKIEIEWITDDEEFLAPMQELTLPGFGAVKFSMNDLVRTEEEKITIDNDGDTSVEMTIPIKDGTVSFNLLYSNASGEFIGLGKSSTERLATAPPQQKTNNQIRFYEKESGNQYHSWFVASYNVSGEAESVLLRAKVSYDSGSGKNETIIEKNVGGTWTEACADKTIGSTCDMGLISLTISDINHTSGGNESVLFTAGPNVNFNTVYTKGGLRVYLPFLAANSTAAPYIGSPGRINSAQIDSSAADGYTTAMDNNSMEVRYVINGSQIGQGWNTWALTMYAEDKDDNIAAGRIFNVSLDDTSNNKLNIDELDESGTGGPQGLEVGASTGVYEAYLASDSPPRILHYTKPDEDWMEIYYPSGDSESYAEVFLTEAGASVSGGGTTGGGGITVGVPITDREVSLVAGKNLIVVGGGCVNTEAASLLGSSSPLCGADFTAKTTVGAGQFLIETFARSGGAIATLVAGYNADDTTNAGTYLRTQTVDTTVGKKYVGTSSSSATLVTA